MWLFAPEKNYVREFLQTLKEFQPKRCATRDGKTLRYGLIESLISERRQLV
jgi:hypothetical protein